MFSPIVQLRILVIEDNPGDFINNLIASSQKDFKLQASTFPLRDDEQERKSKYYFQPYVDDGVRQYLDSTIPRPP